MVQLTSICLKYMPFYLRRSEARSVYFRRQALFRLTGTFYGLSRNVWRVAINKWLKKMVYLQEYRKRYDVHLKDLHAQRLLAACEEHDLKMEHFLNTLVKCDIELDIKMLSQLAIYEPRTFKSLVDLAKTVRNEMGETENARRSKPPPGVLTRGMLPDIRPR